MKVRLDENISYRVANALKAFLSNRSGLEISWVRDHHPPGTDDPTWLRAFSSEGGQVVVSGDANIVHHWPNLMAFRDSGLIAFFPPAPFDRMGGYTKAANIIIWWPAIIEKAKGSKPGDAWRWTFKWSPSVDDFKALRDPRARDHS